MLKYSLQAIKERPLFSNLKLTNQDTWVPQSVYISGHFCLRLVANRKDQCTEGHITTKTALLRHPVLGPSVSLVVQDFLSWIPELPEELRSAEWVTSASDESIRVGKLVLSRQVTETEHLFKVGKAPNFFTGLFKA